MLVVNSVQQTRMYFNIVIFDNQTHFDSPVFVLSARFEIHFLFNAWILEDNLQLVY